MKIARVFTNSIAGRQAGDIFDVFDPDKHPGKLLQGSLVEINVADDFDMEIMNAQVFAEKWTKNGEGDLFVDPQDETWTHLVGDFWGFAIDVDKQAAKAQAALVQQVTDLYNTMNTEVYAKMAEVFGTNNADSATAYYETWKLMVESPAIFAGQGLTSDMEVLDAQDQVLYAAGASLELEADVLAWATRRIEIAQEYGVWRALRIQQFRNEKDALLNP